MPCLNYKPKKKILKKKYSLASRAVGAVCKKKRKNNEESEKGNDKDFLVQMYSSRRWLPLVRKEFSRTFLTLIGPQLKSRFFFLHLQGSRFLYIQLSLPQVF